MKIDFDLHPKQEVYRILNIIGFITKNQKNTCSIFEIFLKETIEYSETCKGKNFIFKEIEYLEKMQEEFNLIKEECLRKKNQLTETQEETQFLTRLEKTF